MSKHLTGLRRGLTVIAAVAALLGATAGCALEGGDGGDSQTESGATAVKVGYLHTVAVDTHMWLGIEEGIYADHDLKIEPVQFDTGLALSQALGSGDVDVAIMGAVLSNFPARGGSKVFLANDIEYDTAQLWAADGSGIKSVKDLKGKKILTTKGTTAHVYLYNALKANGLSPDDVNIVNADMPAAVSGFISGAAPAVVLWVPFDKTVMEKAPSAKLIDSAKNYFPEASILGGWLASDDFFENDRDTLNRLTEAWMEINDLLVNDTETSLKTVHEAAYKDDQSFADTKRNFSFEKVYDNDQWAEHYENGDVAKWIGRTEQVFVDIGGLPKFVEPSEFFDPNVFLDAYKAWKDSK